MAMRIYAATIQASITVYILAYILANMIHYHESLRIEQRVCHLQAPTRALYGGHESEVRPKFGKTDESF